MSMRVLVTLRPSTFKESNPSVFLGRACNVIRFKTVWLSRDHSQMRWWKRH
jgi:hypothetical protein